MYPPNHMWSMTLKMPPGSGPNSCLDRDYCQKAHDIIHILAISWSKKDQEGGHTPWRHSREPHPVARKVVRCGLYFERPGDLTQLGGPFTVDDWRMLSGSYQQSCSLLQNTALNTPAWFSNLVLPLTCYIIPLFPFGTWRDRRSFLYQTFLSSWPPSSRDQLPLPRTCPKVTFITLSLDHLLVFPQCKLQDSQE